jgi:hypothetical protein
MSLGPGRRNIASLPDLAPGDRLEVTAEVEVTTDCARAGAGCVGNPYGFAPTVRAQLLLARDRDVIEVAEGRALRLSDRRQERISHHEHHRVLVFTRAGIRIPDRGLPWGPRPSFVNLVLDAHHPAAGRRHVLLIGENEPNGTVRGDKGRINALRLHGHPPRPDPLRTRSAEHKKIPVDRERRTVIYSLPLERLGEGAQLTVQARLTTSSAHLSFPTRVSTRLILADRRDQTDLGGRAREVASFGGEIAENNGFNCLPGASPCLTRKVGILRMRKPARRRLFVNLVAVSADPSGGGRPGDAVRVVDGGELEVVRYPPRLKG